MMRDSEKSTKIKTKFNNFKFVLPQQSVIQQGIEHEQIILFSAFDDFHEVFVTENEVDLISGSFNAENAKTIR
jgi:hypothetical protein